ncbi:MAG: DUF429 domain-containing protein [Gaiellaceae bacterium]
MARGRRRRPRIPGRLARSGPGCGRCPLCSCGLHRRGRPDRTSTAGERRRADAAARALVGVRRSSIFWAPPRAALAAATYAEARLVDPTLSAQAFALKRAILDAEQQGSRVQEGHPEASFRALAGSPLRYAKRTWNGQMLRRQLLATAGIQLSDDLLEAGLVPPDDVLDAAAMAWTARRVAAGISETLPADPTHTEPVIRY